MQMIGCLVVLGLTHFGIVFQSISGVVGWCDGAG